MEMTDALRVVSPLAVTAAMLVSTDVPENDYDEWSASKTYQIGDRVIVASAHTIYQSVKDANLNKPPATDDRSNWLPVSATNRWKAFDPSITTQTKQANKITYRLKAGMATNGFSALNLSGATSMRVRIIDPTFGTAYDRIINLASVPVASGWWAWYFGERTTPTQATLYDLPSLPAADLLIEIFGGADLAVGTLLLGQQRLFALSVEMGASVGIQDYSTKEANQFGDLTIVERGFARRGQFDLVLLAREVDELNNFLARNRAKLCLWIFSTRYEATTIYGIYQNFDILINYFTHSDCSIEILGVT